MQTIRRAKLLGLAAFAVTASFTTGCQTWIGGMTLPSPHYLEGHPPQYFPEEPQFPLTRELAYQEETSGLLKPMDKARNVQPVPAVGGAPK
jgi:hypothetical protein